MNHPRREAIGVCVECRGQMCGECVTRVDGINYCVTCLAHLARVARPEESAGTGLGLADVSQALAPAFVAGWLLLLTLLGWGLVEAVFPGG